VPVVSPSSEHFEHALAVQNSVEDRRSQNLRFSRQTCVDARGSDEIDEWILFDNPYEATDRGYGHGLVRDQIVLVQRIRSSMSSRCADDGRHFRLAREVGELSSLGLTERFRFG